MWICYIWCFHGSGMPIKIHVTIIPLPICAEIQKWKAGSLANHPFWPFSPHRNLYMIQPTIKSRNQQMLLTAIKKQNNSVQGQTAMRGPYRKMWRTSIYLKIRAISFSSVRIVNRGGQKKRWGRGMESVANLSFNICFLVPETRDAALAHQLIKAIISHCVCVYSYVWVCVCGRT